MPSINMRGICEDYCKAQRSREKDFLMVKRANRKVMAIHLGGVYIECLLKSIIINKHGVIKDKVVVQQVNGRPHKYICWYNLAAYNRLLALPSVDDNALIANRTAQNPEHDLVRAFRQIDELNIGAPAQIITSLSYLNKPLNKKYIDYRYMGDDEVSDIDYQYWEQHFLTFIHYFHIRKSAFPFSV